MHFFVVSLTTMNSIIQAVKKVKHIFEKNYECLLNSFKIVQLLLNGYNLKIHKDYKQMVAGIKNNGYNLNDGCLAADSGSEANGN